MPVIDMKNCIEEDQTPAPELIPFGWAPGGYIQVCGHCDVTHVAAKRASSCRACATRALEASAAKPKPTPDAYTLEDVDAALRAIIGARVFDALRQSSGWSRTSMMSDAARRCFAENRPEDEHTRILRAAIRRLDETGVILPEDVRR